MSRPCPFCSGRARGYAFPFETRWNGRTFHFVACADCDTTYVDPVPTEEEFREMYAVETYHDEHYSSGDASRHDSSMAMLRCAREGGRSRLLDFGCGDGSFLARARAEGWSVVGVEHDSRAATVLSERTGFDVTTLDLVRARGSAFDVIHLGDVLEHLPDPATTLERLRAQLAPNGLFFVEGPLQANASVVYFVARTIGRLKRAAGRSRPGDQPPTHLILTNAEAQRRFFAVRMRYRVVAWTIDETGWPYLSSDAPRGLGGRARRVIGQAAVAVARAPLLEGRLGNRFSALLMP